MHCSICDKKIDQTLIYTITDNIVLAHFSIVLKNKHNAVCFDCYSSWTKILEILFQIFKDKKQIDENLIKRILEREFIE